MKWIFGRTALWLWITVATAAVAFAAGQQSIDLPEGDGKKILERNYARGTLGTEILDAVVEAKGDYKIEVAHQQIRYRKHHVAFSSRIGRHGDLILDMDVGDPALESRIVIEADLARAERQSAAKREDERDHRPRRGW